MLALRAKRLFENSGSSIWQDFCWRSIALWFKQETCFKKTSKKTTESGGSSWVFFMNPAEFLNLPHLHHTQSWELQGAAKSHDAWRWWLTFDQFVMGNPQNMDRHGSKPIYLFWFLLPWTADVWWDRLGCRVASLRPKRLKDSIPNCQVSPQKTWNLDADGHNLEVPAATCLSLPFWRLVRSKSAEWMRILAKWWAPNDL